MEAQVYAKHNQATISPKKVAPVMNLIRGKPVYEAKVTLAFDKTKAAKLILKVLKSAEANAVNTKNLKGDKLYVSEVWVGSGPSRKWGRFAGRGRYSRILKRTSNICIGLSEKEQAK